MEKFGVELDQEKVKEASAETRGTCPKCGKTLVSDGQLCPSCGSEPFEKRPEEHGSGDS